MQLNPSKSYLPFNAGRIEAIDLLRGIVMILMVLDHTRDYFHRDAWFFSPTDISQASAILFFTRFVTHYCAPVFVFIAGTAACCYGMKRQPGELTYFLFTRGMWLVFVEIVLINLFRTFDLSFPFINLQVIWVLGLCMVVLSVLHRLPTSWMFALGMSLTFGHNLLDGIHVPGNTVSAFLWAVLHDTGQFDVGSVRIALRYALLPWLGLMCLGYALGALYRQGIPPGQRAMALRFLGGASLSMFFLLRIINAYGDPVQWKIEDSAAKTIMSFMNVSKYPPSLHYALVTIGPALLFLSLPKFPESKWKEAVSIFGRVPMFFYLAHVLVIHLLALIGVLVDGYRLRDMIIQGPVNSAPQLIGYGFNLGIVYLVWILVLLILFPVCKRFDRYKRTNGQQQKWLSYF